MSNSKDTYLTIEARSEGEFRDRGSRFLAYAFPAYSENDCQQALEVIRKEHSKARHHCYAYRLGMDNIKFRANDDGEPSGTAGRPILGQIDSFGLTNIIIIVVRYFGGTLLGTSGLINAYKQSAAEALGQAVIVKKVIEDMYSIRFEYALMSSVMNAIKRFGVDMIKQDFGHEAQVDIAIRKSESDDTLKKMKAAIAGIYLEEVEQLEQIEGCYIEYLGDRG
jgi:uncharacterized YigZ family protein